MSDCRIELSPHLSKYEVADQLRYEGYWREAQAIERGQCLSDHQAREVEHFMERDLDLHKHFDFDVRDCGCHEDD